MCSRPHQPQPGGERGGGEGGTREVEGENTLRWKRTPFGIKTENQRVNAAHGSDKVVCIMGASWSRFRSGAPVFLMTLFGQWSAISAIYWSESILARINTARTGRRGRLLLYTRLCWISSRLVVKRLQTRSRTTCSGHNPHA